jgi:hypothetical protein
MAPDRRWWTCGALQSDPAHRVASGSSGEYATDGQTARGVGTDPARATTAIVFGFAISRKLQAFFPSIGSQASCRTVRCNKVL